VAFTIKGQPAVRWYPLIAYTGALALVPWIQFCIGLLPYAGQAWMSSAYILAAMLSMILGDVWERKWPLELINSLFLAIGVACIGSVALQLYVWSGVAMGGEWGVFASGLDRVRPAGNLGQPNQLATHLLWGVLATLWGYWRRYMGAKVSILLAFLLVTGLSITLSRTGMVNAGLIVAALLLWRKFNYGKYFKLTVLALFGYCVLLQFVLPMLVESMLLGQVDGSLRAANSNSQRLLAWKIFAEAAQQRPWLRLD
jgi:hypothetical protein